MLLFSIQDKIKNTKSTRTGPAMKIRKSTTSKALSSVLQEPKGKKTESEYYRKVQKMWTQQTSWCCGCKHDSTRRHILDSCLATKVRHLEPGLDSMVGRSKAFGAPDQLYLDFESSGPLIWMKVLNLEDDKSTETSFTKCTKTFFYLFCLD